MGFGGGGDGSVGVTNHIHDNSVGEGGSLSTSQTLIDSTNLYTRIIAGA
jgi:hypothetical protein|tara:strand:+ start:589 stop:735 length:147 start_codon:yes stop_codon:yes gene_type:complete